LGQKGSRDVASAQLGGPEPGPEFIRQVRDALRYLHDRTRLQTHPLASYASRSSDKRASGRGQRLQDDLLQAIEALRPSLQVPNDAPSARNYQLLTNRYVEAQEATEVQHRLAIGKTEYYADQQRALDAVASVLWERWCPEPVVAAERLGAHGASGRAPTAPANPTAPAGDAAPAPRANLARPRHNLPVQLTSFVGREAVLADLTRALATTRLLTLTGVGGTGKTRLALQAATNALASYKDGAWFVDLAPLVDPVLIPQTIASVLGVLEQSGEPILTTVLRVLGDQQVLLILDNCEHLLDACAHLVDVLLRGCLQLQILATSREALGIGGEVTRRVPSLAVPSPEHLPPLELLTQYEAVQLFVERALAVQPAFAVTAENASPVAQLCWRLDGIPLAIELAAARLRVLSVEQVASRLGDRFRLLTGGSRTALRRQQTLQAAIDWSHDLLSAPERTLFRRLAVFAGGFSLEAAEGMCSEGLPQQDVLDLLTGLVDKSLVLADEQGVDARYRLLETIRQYAGEKLVSAGEAEAVRDRHLDWYLRLAEQAKPELIGPNQVAWLDRLERDQANLRAALEWALERGAGDRALRLVAGVWRLWYVRDRRGEGREWLLRVLAATDAATPTRARAEALDGACEIAMSLRGDDPVVARLGEESLAMYRSLGDRRGGAWALCHLANQAGSSGDPTRAEELAAEALVLARQADAPWVVAQALEKLGLAAMSRGDYPLARHRFDESLATFRSLGDRRAVYHGLQCLAWCSFEQGDYGASRNYALECLPIARELRSSGRIGLALTTLGMIARQEGNSAQSRALLEEGLALARETGDREPTGFAFLNLGWLSWVDSDVGRAERMVKECLAVFHDIDHQEGAAAAIGLQGVLSISRGANRRGACLLSTIASRQVSPVWLPPEGRRAHEESIAAARAALGEDDFATAWAEGQAMTLDEAVIDALEEAEGYAGKCSHSS
jgi:predicted ATPase